HHGKSARALGADLEERGFRIDSRAFMKNVFDQLVESGISTRRASSLAGVSRATMARHKRAERFPPKPVDAPRPAPANKLTEAEEALILETLNSDRFVDQAPE
ncbi:IS3-like element ISAar44 family transposase, partial [Glutamicibacter ardleyensis]